MPQNQPYEDFRRLRWEQDDAIELFVLNEVNGLGRQARSGLHAVNDVALDAKTKLRQLPLEIESQDLAGEVNEHARCRLEVGSNGRHQLGSRARANQNVLEAHSARLLGRTTTHSE